MRGAAVRLCLVAAALALQGCELALLGAGGAAVTAIEDRRTSGTLLDDGGIERRASGRIDERFRDSSLAHVNVTSYSRSVLLTGEVPDERARDEIEKMVLALPNVRGVANELQVAGVSSLSARASDSLITSRIKARFLDAGKFNPIHVKVVTEAGVVYLLGLVLEQEAEDAVEIARTTAGVRKVVKMFDYCAAGDERCVPRAKPPAEKPRPPRPTV